MAGKLIGQLVTTATPADADLLAIQKNGEITVKGITVSNLLTNKTDKIIPATVGNVAGLDATGNLTDLAFGMSWNVDDETVDVPLTTNVTGQMFQEMFFDAKNATGSDIDDGVPVMFAAPVGASGKVEVQLAIADGSIDAQYIMGISTEPIVNGGFGKITAFGKVRGVDTTGTLYGEVWANGDLLYVGLTAGALTNVEPNAPGQRILVAVVIIAHAVNGTLLVRPTWRGKMTDMDDVNGTPLTTDGQILVWDNGNAYFDPNANISDFADRLKTISTSTTTATIGDDIDIHVCNGTTNYTVTLPTPATGKVLTIVNKNTATVTLVGTINLISATDTLISGESISLTYDGTEWI